MGKDNIFGKPLFALIPYQLKTVNGNTQQMEYQKLYW